MSISGSDEFEALDCYADFFDAPATEPKKRIRS